jgi:LacI family transcriptional regulator
MMTRRPGKAPLRSGPTISDVAALAGVNKTTVSVVLNGNRSGTRVSEATRVRIQHAASELGYQANAIARGLAEGRMYVIGVLFSGFEVELLSNYYVSGILQGVMWAASTANYNVLLFSKSARDVEHSTSFVRDRRSDGFIVVDPDVDPSAVSALAMERVPLVALGSRSEVHGVPAVDVDNEAGARAAAEHLVGLGHRRIGHLTGRVTHAASAERCQAYRQVLHSAGIDVPEEYVLETDFDKEQDYVQARRLLSLRNRPTAIFAANDLMAIAVMAAARDLGISVPGELSVVGFDDIAASELVTPPLTTVRQPLREIGDIAAHMLMRTIDGEAIPPETKLVPPQLIVRGSTAPRP